MTRSLALAFLVASALAAAAPNGSADAPEDAELSASDVQRRWLGRLDGRHFNARIRLVLEREGWREERTIDVWRDDEESRRERLMARFDMPLDMRGFGVLYLENPGRPNDYFVYQPATRRVRRVPEVLAREDVYGVDLEYLGFGVAQLEPTQVESVEWDVLDGKRVVRLVERAERDNPRFQTRVVWLDPETFLPVRSKHLLGDEVTLVASTEEVSTIQSVPTPVRIAFVRPQQDERVVMKLESIDYREPIPEQFFSTLALIKRR